MVRTNGSMAIHVYNITQKQLEIQALRYVLEYGIHVYSSTVSVPFLVRTRIPWYSSTYSGTWYLVHGCLYFNLWIPVASRLWDNVYITVRIIKPRFEVFFEVFVRGFEVFKKTSTETSNGFVNWENRILPYYGVWTATTVQALEKSTLFPLSCK